MLKKLSIQNFKAFGEPISDIEIAPLTILLGPNASGKSAVLDALGLLSQTAANHSNTSGYHWKGPWIQFDPVGKSAFHNGRINSELVLGIDVQLPVNPTDQDSSRAQTTLNVRFTIRHNGAKGDWQHTLEFSNGMKATSSFRPGPGQQPTLTFTSIPGEFNPLNSPGPIFSSQVFIPSSARSGPADVVKARQIGTECGFAIELIRSWLEKQVFMIGPDRLPGGEEPEPRKSGFSVGRHGEDTLNLLTYLFASPEHSDTAAKIQHWAQVFGLGGLKAGWIRQKELQAGFNDPESKTALSLRYAGYGSQQILPVIAQIFAAPKRSTILMEEPEISLHPSAQLEIMNLFGDAIQFGQQILATTHSQILPLALSELSKYSILPSDVALYHLVRNSTSVKLQRLEVDSKWNLPNWIPSFSSVEAKLLKTWISKVHGDIQ